MRTCQAAIGSLPWGCGSLTGSLLNPRVVGPAASGRGAESWLYQMMQYIIPPLNTTGYEDASSKLGKHVFEVGLFAAYDTLFSCCDSAAAFVAGSTPAGLKKLAHSPKMGNGEEIHSG